MKQTQNVTLSRQGLLLIYLCMGIFSACSGNKPAQSSSNSTPNVLIESDSSNQAFLKFVNSLETFEPKKVMDYPPGEWGRIYADTSRRIAEPEMERFIRPNFKKYPNPIDSLLTFVKKNDLLRMPAYMLGKIKHENEQNITILLLFLQAETQSSIQKHYALSYHSSKSGKPLGYDLLSGSVINPEVHSEYIGRWGVRKQGILINRSVYEPKQRRFQAQKYKVVFNKGSGRKEVIRAREERLYTLQGTPKVIDGVEYRRHCDAEVRYFVDLPYQLFTFLIRTARLGVSEDFESEDGQANLTFYRRISSYGLDYRDEQGRFDLKEYFLVCKYYAQESAKKLTYTYLNDEYFVLSGIQKDGRIFYEKHIGETHFSLVYPAAQRALYDKVVEQIEKSFKLKW